MTRRYPTNFLIGAGLAGLVILVAAMSLVWTPHPFAEIDIARRFQPASGEFWLGTDHLGRDVVSQLMVGARSSVLIAFSAVLLGGSIGVVLGLTAASAGGLVEDAIMRLADFSLAFPAILFAMMLAALFGPSLANTVVAISFINIPVFTRVVRSAALQVQSQDFILAARAAARDRVGIVRDHVIPNILPAITVLATIEFAIAILVEAALSYLGLGVQLPTPSWGRMLSQAQTLLYLAPQLAIYPGLCITIAVLGFNMLGDGLRDLTDPRLAKER
ncbi:MAG: ABC transporter permease [Rhizobiaceae bacterium]